MDIREVPELRQGPQFICDAFNMLLAGAKAMFPLSSEVCDVVDVAGGKNFIPRMRGVNGGGDAVSKRPLQLVNGSEEGVYRVVYGTVAGLSTPFSPGDDPVFEIAVDSGNKVYVILSVDYDGSAGLWTATSLDFGQGAVVPSADSGTAYFEIGSVSGGGAPASAVGGSLAHQRCGDDDNFNDLWGSV